MSGRRTRRELSAASLVPLAWCQAPPVRPAPDTFEPAEADHRVGSVCDLMFGRDVDAVHREAPPRHLSAGGIAHAGAGPDVAAARAPALVDAGGLDVAVLGPTDDWSQFGAGPDSPGTAHLALSPDAETRRAVRNGVAAAREADADLVVASFTGARVGTYGRPTASPGSRGG